MPFAQISHQQLFYSARGQQSAPIVFIHGAGDNHLLWNGQVAALADMARPMALDLPGHGRSTGGGRSSIYDYAIAVEEFLEALSLEQAVIVGTSMGGAIAQTLALEFPKRVAGLGLVGTGARLRVAPDILSGLQNDYAATIRMLVENYYAPNAPNELKLRSAQVLQETGQAVTYGDYSACNMFDAMPRVHDIRVPTLILCGRADRMTPPKYSEYLATQIPHSDLVIIENAGHMVMLEQPEELNRVVREWLVQFAL